MFDPLWIDPQEGEIMGSTTPFTMKGFHRWRLKELPAKSTIIGLLIPAAALVGLVSGAAGFSLGAVTGGLALIVGPLAFFYSPVLLRLAVKRHRTLAPTPWSRPDC